ncbi:MAG: TlpA disulfide reductase family protein [bacterium]
MSRVLRTPAPWFFAAALGLVLMGCGGGDEQTAAEQDTASEGRVTVESSPETTTRSIGSAVKPVNQQASPQQVAGEGQPSPVSTKVTTGCLPGQMAPDFSLNDLMGNAVTLSDLRGDVVIVDFWATWCGPCRRVMPHLQEIHDKFGEKGVTIVAVTLDKNPDRVVPPYLKQNKYSFTVVISDGTVTTDYCGIESIPTTFVIAPDGRVFKQYTGAMHRSVYLSDIKALKPELTM